MDLIPILSIPVLYVFVALIKPTIQPKLPFNLCAICVAVSLTWLGLLILWVLDFSISVLPLAILMGMSVVGIMYRAEALFKRGKIKHFWFVRLVIVMGGFYSIYLLAHERWDVLLLVLIASFFLIAIPTFLLQGTTHSDVIREQKVKGIKSSLLKKLDNCC